MKVFFVVLLIPAKGGLPCACPMFGTAVPNIYEVTTLKGILFCEIFDIFMFVCTFHLQNEKAFNCIFHFI